MTTQSLATGQKKSQDGSTAFSRLTWLKKKKNNHNPQVLNYILLVGKESYTTIII